MEFYEKLQELRKRKGITQEELAECLFVSRPAVSKWESGRGYPNIDSLKAIAKFYEVTIDELLSGDELLVLAEEDSRQKETRIRDLVFGLLDCSAVMFYFLPFFGQKQDAVEAVSLLSLTGIAPYLKMAYHIAVIGIVVSGILTLATQNCQQVFRERNKGNVSLAFNILGVLLFIISSQPYPAVLLFLFLVIKVPMLIKRP